jgi:hypothetical protein
MVGAQLISSRKLSIERHSPATTYLTYPIPSTIAWKTRRFKIISTLFKYAFILGSADSLSYQGLGYPRRGWNEINPLTLISSIKIQQLDSVSVLSQYLAPLYSVQPLTMPLSILHTSSYS